MKAKVFMGSPFFVPFLTVTSRTCNLKTKFEKISVSFPAQTRRKSRNINPNDNFAKKYRLKTLS